MAMADKGNQGGIRVWPSLEAAARMSDAANWVLIVSLVIGAASAVLVLYTTGIKEAKWNVDRQVSHETIVKLQTAVSEANTRAAQAGDAVAAANARAAQAADEALEANARATEAGAALSLARYQTPRTLSQEQQSRIIEKLQTLAPAPYDVSVASGPEPAMLLMRIDEMLGAAKWIRRERDAGTDQSARIDADSVEGVSVEIADSKREDWEPTVIALILALRAEGIFANGTANPDADPSAIHLAIGNKPQGGSHENR
jgi:hypothetical protein